MSNSLSDIISLACRRGYSVSFVPDKFTDTIEIDVAKWDNPGRRTVDTLSMHIRHSQIEVSRFDLLHQNTEAIVRALASSLGDHDTVKLILQGATQ